VKLLFNNTDLKNKANFNFLLKHNFNSYKFNSTFAVYPKSDMQVTVYEVMNN